jgi:hypothetical protein
VGEFTQSDVPVAQEVVPVRQGSGFVSQPTPATQATQLPALQTRSVPQLVPFAIGVAVSRQVWVPVEQDVVPATQAFELVEQETPAEHAVHTPELQTWLVPQTVPFAVGVVPFTQVWVPVAQDVVPRRHGSRLVSQAASATQLVHAPPLQTRFVPHTVPFGSGAAVSSTQVEVPVLQDVLPPRHGSGLAVQAVPSVQETHVADGEQTRFVPQLVPAGFAVPSTQVSAPVPQEVTPYVHAALGLVVQASPAVHAVHWPVALQTRFVPQSVPLGSGTAGLSTQVCVPVAQEKMPVRQGSGLVVQVPPAAHAVHEPALQTSGTPGSTSQVVPFATTVAESTQTEVPVAHEVVPVTQGFGFPLHETPATQVAQTPPLQTWLVPQSVPFGSGASALSTHVWLPVEHEVVPVRHRSGLVSQATPAAHGTQAAAVEQTRFVPQLVPAGFGASSTQAWTPVAQEVTPKAHAAFGFVVQASPAVQAEQAPPLHTRLVPQDVPFGSGAAALSTQICVPVLQDVVPARHGSGLVEQVVPAVQETHVAEVEQTRFVPQLVPAGFAAASTQVWVPLAHEVVP